MNDFGMGCLFVAPAIGCANTHGVLGYRPSADTPRIFNAQCAMCNVQLKFSHDYP